MAETVYEAVNLDTDKNEARKRAKNKQLGHEEGNDDNGQIRTQPSTDILSVHLLTVCPFVQTMPWGRTALCMATCWSSGTRSSLSGSADTSICSPTVWSGEERATLGWVCLTAYTLNSLHVCTSCDRLSWAEGFRLVHHLVSVSVCLCSFHSEGEVAETSEKAERLGECYHQAQVPAVSSAPLLFRVVVCLPAWKLVVSQLQFLLWFYGTANVSDHVHNSRWTTHPKPAPMHFSTVWTARHWKQIMEMSARCWLVYKWAGSNRRGHWEQENKKKIWKNVKIRT